MVFGTQGEMTCPFEAPKINGLPAKLKNVNILFCVCKFNLSMCDLDDIMYVRNVWVSSKHYLCLVVVCMLICGRIYVNTDCDRFFKNKVSDVI